MGMLASGSPAVAEAWRGRRVLVTGCSGFVGSWLTQELVAQGAEVVGVLRDQIRDSWLYRSGTSQRMTLVSGALEDLLFVQRVLNEYGIQAVFHLAAQSQVGVANRSPLSTFQSNIVGTCHVLEACRTLPAGQLVALIVASSDKAYGEQALPYTEANPLLGRYPYDASKACADLLAQTYARTYGLPVGIVRCANIYGGGDLNFNRLIPETIRAILGDQRPVIRSDGKFLRDYLYVGDAVSAYLSLGAAVAAGRQRGEAFNFGGDRPVSVLDVVRMLLELTKHSALEPDIRNEARGEIRDQYLSSAKAARELGWKPQVPLREGLRETVQWYQRYRPWEESREDARVPANA
jgi:CDP-glucose 4,6-dehydratase